MKKYVLFLIAVPSIFASSTHCGNCTEAGCTSTVSSSATVNVDLAAMDGAPVTICCNSSCVNGTTVATTHVENGEETSVLLCEFPDNSGRASCVGRATDSAGVTLALTYYLDDDETPDGDSYRFEVRSPDDTNEVLVLTEGSVTFTVSQPNGPECEPTCYNATL